MHCEAKGPEQPLESTGKEAIEAWDDRAPCPSCAELRAEVERLRASLQTLWNNLDVSEEPSPHGHYYMQAYALEADVVRRIKKALEE
jgi:hypothetical protein